MSASVLAVHAFARRAVAGGLLLGALTSLPSSAAEPAAPAFTNLISTAPDDISWMSGTCTVNTDTPGEALCTFTQTRVSRKTSPADVPAKIEAARKDMEAHYFKAGKATDELHKFCAGFTTQEAAEKLATMPPSRAKESALQLRALCQKPNEEALIRWVTALIEQETRTCRIWVSVDDPKRFSHVTPTKWIYTGVVGLCNSAITIVLESEHESLWTYTQVRNTKDNDKVCDALEVGHPLVYSWRDKPLELACEQFEFGP